MGLTAFGEKDGGGGREGGRNDRYEGSEKE